MPILNVTKTEILAYLFQNAAIAGIGDASGLQPSAAAGDLYISLHTANPGRTGNQTTSEVSLAAYPTYARVAVPRSALGWEVTENRVRNVADIDFPACVGGTSPTVVYVGIGTDAAGAGLLLHMAPVGDAAGLIVAGGVLPRFPAELLALYFG